MTAPILPRHREAAAIAFRGAVGDLADWVAWGEWSDPTNTPHALVRMMLGDISQGMANIEAAERAVSIDFLRSTGPRWWRDAADALDRAEHRTTAESERTARQAGVDQGGCTCTLVRTARGPGGRARDPRCPVHVRAPGLDAPESLLCSGCGLPFCECTYEPWNEPREEFCSDCGLSVCECCASTEVDPLEFADDDEPPIRGAKR